MPNQIQKSSTARIVSIIVLLGLIPAWFFFIGVRYSETINAMSINKEKTESYLLTGK